MKITTVTGILVVLFLFFAGCSNKSDELAELAYYPVDSMEDIISRSETEMDYEMSTDGNGSLRMTASKPAAVRLYETGDLDIENARIIYSAKIRTEGVQGQVFLEMWCSFPGKGEFFSRALHSPLTGTNEWTTQKTPFFLKKGDNPDNVKLNLVINGTGTVWIDDIHLAKGPLK